MFSSGTSGKSISPRGWQIVVVVALLAAVSVMPLCLIANAIMGGKAPESAFWPEFLDDLGPAVLGAVVAICAPLWVRFTWNWPWRAWGERLIRNRIALMVAAFVLYGFIMQWAARNIVYTPDEYCAVLQARTLAQLQLTPKVDPQLVKLVTPSWMQNDFILVSSTTGRYSPTYWPGYALLMTPFAAIGAPWLCNAALSVMAFFLMWALGKRLTGKQEGGMWALLLTLGAAQVALQAGTYFSMPAHLAFNLLFCWFITNNTKRSTFLAGLTGSFALILHNPAPHFCFALPWVVWIAMKRRQQLLPLIAGYALICLPVGISWSAYLGSFDADKYVIKAAQQGNDAGGFSAVVSRIFFVLRPPEPLLLLARVAGIVKWIVWSVPGTAGLAVLAYLQLRKAQKNEREAQPSSAEAVVSNKISTAEANQYLRLFVASAIANLVIYLFVRFDQGHGWGNRYIHQTWMTLPLLATAFVTGQNGTWKRFSAALCLGGLFVVLPARILQMHTYFEASERGRPSVEDMRPPAPPSSPSITFLKERPRGTTFIQNDPYLKQPDWILRSTTPEQNSKVAQYYLSNARKAKSDQWTETWIGDSFAHPGSP